MHELGGRNRAKLNDAVEIGITVPAPYPDASPSSVATPLIGHGVVGRPSQSIDLVGASKGALDRQRVEPLRYPGGAAAAQAKLLAVLNGLARVKIGPSSPDRITAEFRSALFGFVDDVVFQFGPSGVIQVRSASRSGYYDFGVNRERVEAIRARFSAAP